MPVNTAERPLEVPTEDGLHHGGEARYRVTRHRARDSGFLDEAGSRLYRGRPASKLSQDLPVDRDEVDAMSCPVFEKAPVRHEDLRPLDRRDPQAEWHQSVASRRQLTREVADHEIEVVMAASLVPEYRVDPPTPGEKGPHSGSLQRVDDLQHFDSPDLASNRGTQGREEAQG